MIKSLIGIFDISMGVALMLGSAAIIIFKGFLDGAFFMMAGFVVIAMLKGIDYEIYRHKKSYSR